MDRVDYQPLIVQDLLNWYKSEEIELNPWYQRRSVWKSTQQSYLINTLLEKKPVPAIYVRHAIDMEKEKSIREVVDGQQRIRAILDFIEDKYTVRHPADGKRKKYSQLSIDQKRDFLSTALSVGYLLGANDADVIDIFGRINSVSKTLNAQEKLNAKYSGEYKQFCQETASDYVSFWRDRNIFTATNISRMEEVRFVADVTLNLLKGIQDFTPTHLEAVYREFDEEFPQYEETRKRWDGVIGRLIDVDPGTVKDTIFSRTPLLFSLVLVMDEIKSVRGKKLEEKLLSIDSLFHDEDLEDREVAAFRDACQSSTQRIAQRQVRHRFILSKLD